MEKEKEIEKAIIDFIEFIIEYYSREKPRTKLDMQEYLIHIKEILILLDMQPTEKEMIYKAITKLINGGGNNE